MAQKSKTQTPARSAPARKVYTLERATTLCASEGIASALCRHFGLDPVPTADIRETTEEHLVLMANALKATLNERAMAIHFQRIVGSFVGSANGAGEFYTAKVTTARELTSKLDNDDRDEDREPVYGFDSKAQRARLFAAEMGLQSLALLAAAEGAVSAYAHITGETWKPYEADAPANTTVDRRAAAAEMDAFSRG